MTATSMVMPTFSAKTDFPVGTYPHDVVPLDFDGDGKLDLIIGNVGSGDFTYLRNTGNGTLGDYGHYRLAGGAWGVASGGITGDSRPEMVFAYGTRDISIVVNDGPGSSWRTETQVNANQGAVMSVAATDLNGDGKADLLVPCVEVDQSGGPKGKLDVLINNGNMTFTVVHSYDLHTADGHVAAIDVNGDGRVDAVVVGNQIDVFLSQGDGSLTFSSSYPSEIGAQAVVGADLNGDGKIDLAVVNRSQGDNLAVYLNRGDGTYSNYASYSSAGASEGTVTVGSQSYGVSAADFNGDGKTDLAVTNNNLGSVSVMLNNGDGTFTSKVIFDTGAGAFGVAAADFNGDGKPDLVVTNMSDGTVSALFNTTDPNNPSGNGGAASGKTVTGSGGDDALVGGAGNDAIDGGDGTDTAKYTGSAHNFRVKKNTDGSFTVTDKTGAEGADTLRNVEKLQFADMTVNLGIKATASAAAAPDVQRVAELYVAFFNRVPDADGMAYWLGQLKAGQSIGQIADAFYRAGAQYPALTGISSTLSNEGFVNIVYKNVLGRSSGAEAEALAYWSSELAIGHANRASLVSTILDSAHSFKGNATWGWVADLLDNKITVAKTFAIDMGLGYSSTSESISKGMDIVAAITATGTSAALDLIGVAPADLVLS